MHRRRRRRRKKNLRLQKTRMARLPRRVAATTTALAVEALTQGDVRQLRRRAAVRGRLELPEGAPFRAAAHGGGGAGAREIRAVGPRPPPHSSSSSILAVTGKMKINIHSGFVNISEDTFAADNNAEINIQGGAVLNIGKGGGLVRCGGFVWIEAVGRGWVLFIIWDGATCFDVFRGHHVLYTVLGLIPCGAPGPHIRRRPRIRAASLPIRIPENQPSRIAMPERNSGHGIKNPRAVFSTHKTVRNN